MKSILDSVSFDECQQRCLAELAALISPKKEEIKNYHCKLWGDILDNDEIDEVMTDALYNVVNKWERVISPQGFYRSTVKQGMRDCVKDKCNRKKREMPQESWQEIEDCSLSDMQERHACEVWQEQREMALHQALATLNDIELQAINMRYFGNMSYGEMAPRLGMTPADVGKYLYRIRTRKLKPVIERYLAPSQSH